MRALFFALMAHGESVVRLPLNSPDTEAMVSAITAFGAKVKKGNEILQIQGVGGVLKAPKAPVDVGNSGQVLRFMGALSALQNEEVILTGDESILTRRPVVPLLEGINQLGGTARSVNENGCAPISIRGPIQAGAATIDGHDSQPVSALLMTTPFLPGVSTITVNNPGETPWIGLTLSWLRRFGVEVEDQGYTYYRVKGGVTLEPFDITIPGDFSTAAYMLALGVINDSELTLHNLDMTDAQGDKALIEVLQKMGANITINHDDKNVSVKRGGQLIGKEIDVNAMIDALPILAVIGCFAEGTTTLTGAAIARKKESDRIATIVAELKKMGATIEERPDGLIVTKSALNGAEIESHADHRIALSLAVAALAASSPSALNGTACIAKSYPTFWNHLQQLGAIQ